MIIRLFITTSAIFHGIALFACAASAQVNAISGAQQASIIQANTSHTLEVLGSNKKWPQLLSVGAVSGSIKWTCAKSKNAKITISPDMKYVEALRLIEGEKLELKRFVPSSMSALVHCELHRFEITVDGPGSLKIN